ncbi:MAG: baseplate J/gp47 family protein [Ginsengibacter sp.]
MANCGENKNPLKRGGTSQRQRSLDALKPGYISVDEHEYQDWIVFANEFGGFLNYFDATNTDTGTWQSFFTSDISSQLGSIAIQDVDVYLEQIKKRFDFLKQDDNRNDIPGLETNLNELFSVLLSLSKAMDEYQRKLPENIVLKNTLLNLIQTKLAPSLNRLISYYKEAGLLNYLTVSSFNGWRVLNKEVVDAAEIISDGLSENWIIGSFANWTDYVNSIANDLNIFSTSLADDIALTADEKEYLRIQHGANHNLFSSIFDQYLFAFTKITNEASTELEKTLTDWDSHQPHYALFLSFLKLFKYAQQQSNTITNRHLDFYYKEVLRLKPKAALPNHAHVLVELAKQVNSYLLAKGTQLKAGKDSKGKDVLYALDIDSTFNKAKVTTLSSVYIANAADTIKNYSVSPATVIQNNTKRLFASPVVNSEDGLGAELKSANKEWHPYVHKEFIEGNLADIVMPEAAIGFAIASHYLYLTEGERKAFIKLVTPNYALLGQKHIECYLTTAKGWHKVLSPSITTSTLTGSPSTSCAQISFTLTGDLPAIENYNAAVHGGTFNCALPILKIYLLQADLTPYEYDTLKDITITAVEVKVEVGMDSGYNQKGIKNLLLSNDAGPLDAAKPFMPFGSQPKTDSTFIIGNKEVFSKKNTQIKLNIEWAGLPSAIDIKYDTSSSTSVPNVDVKFLTGKVWTNTTDPVGSTTPITSLNNVSILNSATKDVSLFSLTQPMPDKGTAVYGEEYLPFSSNTSKGFLQLRLKDDFGYKLYLDTLTLYLIGQSKTPISGPAKPTEPYTPLIQSIYLSYSAYQITDLTSNTVSVFNNRDIRFFHIYPFGDAEQHKYLNNISANTDPVYLLPQFKHWGKDVNGNTIPVYHTGEFYIGIENLLANQAVNILFQAVEGSTDPLIAKPDDHVKWSYLSNNNWVDFNDQEISDATLALLQSGIISFAIPPKATTNNTLLSSGKIWIRAAIENAAEAISKLLSVDAQAAISTFESHDNADDFLNLPLPAGTISKLKTPDAAVKKITQPYSSFGGRPKENEDHFYIRVSERLRHKARAITIWDYEHLILEAFPEIYKVKCLNHTSVFESGGKEYTNEVKPGHVLIITIPLLTNKSEANPLKPYTNQDTLTNIENFLKKKVSCFVTVKTRQPLFEEVGISFTLKLYEQYKDFTFYANMLKNEITQYLTPWAYAGTADVQFGGKIYKSSLINFIEERYYVDFITDVILSHKIDDVNTEDITLEEITASTSRSILVSKPASKHIIVPADEDEASTVVECVSSTSLIL